MEGMAEVESCTMCVDAQKAAALASSEPFSDLHGNEIFCVMAKLCIVHESRYQGRHHHPFESPRRLPIFPHARSHTLGCLARTRNCKLLEVLPARPNGVSLRSQRATPRDSHEDLQRDVVGKDGGADWRLTVLCEGGTTVRSACEGCARTRLWRLTATGSVRRRGVELGEEETGLRAALVGLDVAR